MFYRLYPQTKKTQVFTEKHSQSKLPYHSAKKMRELYPEGGFVIIGEIGNFANTFADQDVLLTDFEKKVPIFPRGSRIKPLEWVAGYIAVGENTYVAAVRSLFPSFLYLRKRKR